MIGTTYHRSYTNYFVIVHKWNTNHFDHSQGLQITETKNGVKDCIFILPSWKQDSPIHPLSQPVSISFRCFDPPAASAQARFTVTTPPPTYPKLMGGPHATVTMRAEQVLAGKRNAWNFPLCVVADEFSRVVTTAGMAPHQAVWASPGGSLVHLNCSK